MQILNERMDQNLTITSKSGFNLIAVQKSCIPNGKSTRLPVRFSFVFLVRNIEYFSCSFETPLIDKEESTGGTLAGGSLHCIAAEHTDS